MAREAHSKKKRKIRTPRLVKPPRIYGGIASSPKINWLDVGLTVVSLLPLGGLVTLGGGLLRGTILAARVAKTARLAKSTKIITTGIQGSGKT